MGNDERGGQRSTQKNRRVDDITLDVLDAAEHLCDMNDAQLSTDHGHDYVEVRLLAFCKELRSAIHDEDASGELPYYLERIIERAFAADRSATQMDLDQLMSSSSILSFCGGRISSISSSERSKSVDVVTVPPGSMSLLPDNMRNN